VCYRLFQQLSAQQGPSFTSVSAADVADVMPFGHIIAKYYRQVLKEVTAGDPVTERALRDWIERSLISDRTRRRQTRQMPAVPEPRALLDGLQAKYLIRDDPRPGGEMYWELSHDVIVAPVLSDNRAWRAKYLDRWQCLAQDWIASNRDDQYLLHADVYLEAPPQGKRDGLSGDELDFLAASQKALEAAGMLTYLERRQSELKARLGLFTLLLGTSLLVNLALIAIVIVSILAF
jgi:hypothetical protein